MNDQLDDYHKGDSTALELYLDNLLDRESEQAFLESERDRTLVAQQKQLQDRIDASLRSQFALNSSECQSLEDLIQNLVSEVPSLPNEAGSAATTRADDESTKSTLAPAKTSAELFQSTVAKFSLAACLLIAIGTLGWVGFSTRLVEPHFVPQPVVLLFDENIKSGFEPYYHCDDPNRFADTFEARHGRRLVLADLPVDKEMLGISYLGGLSRQTTAMLGQVGQEKAIVFVDSQANQNAIDIATEPVDQLPQWNVFVVKKYGLVFVEVSGMESPQFIPYFVPEKPGSFYQRFPKKP